MLASEPQAAVSATATMEGSQSQLSATPLVSTVTSWYSCALGALRVTDGSEESRLGRITDIGPLAPNGPSLQATDGSRESDEIRMAPDELEQSLSMIKAPIRHLMVKERYVGPSHWMQTVLLLPDTMAWFNKSNLSSSPIHALLSHCKSLADRLERQQHPEVFDGSYGKHMPTIDIADRLVRLYLDNFESLHRIVHKPTFEGYYTLYWLDRNRVSTPMLLQIQLCLALGACVFDDRFSLRSSALQYIDEAKTWLTQPENSRPDIERLQLLCLLQLARQNICSLQEDVAWISAGELHRTALCIGLHLDPASLPNLSPYQSEMRRRLWATVLDIQLQSSLDSGNLPLVTLAQASCCLPSNLDDAKLHKTDNELPISLPRETMSDTSLQIAIGRSFGVRLRIVDMANRTNSEPNYKEILHATSELNDAYRALTTTLSSYGSKLSLFHRLLCETFLQPYFLALHVPYMRIAFRDPIFHFSRELCVKRALDLSHAAFASQSLDNPDLMSLRTVADMDPPCIEYTRLSTCGSGPFRSIQIQNNYIIAAELLATSQEENHFASVKATRQTLAQRQDGQSLREVELHALVTSAVKWAENRLLAGETNVKDYLFHVVALAQVKTAKGSQASTDIKTAKGADALRCASKILQNRILDDRPPTFDVPVDDEGLASLWYTWQESSEDALWEFVSM
ncbi:hypothetical protein M436DRAFT_67727 [Aureobasidium namibiae CBS 147.97]|uniref:Xylanolytic transcriptional activator regulatory domain-containing protein n=1 Tax=Aureobasidium namibiae CBS 147.97 TaxID=1043004 RepID=A0A074WG10_9PEZI